jgi:hypothetical protein
MNCRGYYGFKSRYSTVQSYIRYASKPTRSIGTLVAALVILLMGQIKTTTAIAGEFKFVPALSAYEVYNDNIFFQEEDREDDFITIVSPSAVLTYEAPKANVSASYLAGYELFSEHSELDTTENQNATLDLSLEPTRRIRFDLTDSMGDYSGTLSRGDTSRGGGIGYFGYYAMYRRAQDLMLLPEELPVKLNYLDLLTLPSDYWSNSVDTTLSCKISESIDTRVGYSNVFFKFRERERFTLPFEDSWEHSGRGEIDYQHSIQDTFGIDYQFRRFSFTIETDTDVHLVSGRWEHKFSPTLSLSLRGGPIFISSVTRQTGSEENQVSWQGETSLMKSFRKGGASLRYSRSVDTYGGLGGTALFQMVSLDVNRQLTRRLDVGLTGAYGRYRPAVEGTGFFHQDLKYYTTGLDSSYMFTRSLRGISSYYYGHQDLEETGRNLDYHQLALGLEYTVTRWLSSNLLYTYSNYSFPLFFTPGNIRDLDVYSNMVMLGFSVNWPQ